MADKKTLEYQIKVLAQEAVTQLTDMSSKLKDMAQKASSASESIKKNSVTFINLEAAAKQAAASVKLFGASSSELRIMQQKLKEGAVSLVAQGFKPEQEEVKKLVEQYKSLGRQADELDAKSGDITTVFSKLKAEIGNVAAVAAAVKFDQFLVKVGDYALKSADAINTVRNNFGIMLNDMEAGSALADRINAFNVNTPFNLEELSTATQVLKTAKVSLNDMEEYLTRFGDLALGDSQKFASFTNAFAKASAKGKADMEVLNIYMERGIPILDTLAKNLGKTTAEITDMSSKGKISFHDLNEAIKTLTDEGGGYFGTMNLAADSWASTLAGAREATNSLAASLGNMLMPILKRIVNAYTEITNAINSSPLLKGLLAGAVTALAVAINVKMIVALVSLALKLWGAYAAQQALNSAMSLTNPLMLAGIAAVTAATAGFVAYAAAQQKATGTSNEAALAAQKQKEAIQDLQNSAEDYMSFMQKGSLAQAKQTVSNYTTAVEKARQTLESSKKSLASLQEQLSATPKTTPLPYKGYTGYVDKTRQYSNPDYAEIEKKVAVAQRIVDSDQSLYDTLNARLEAAQKNTGVLQQKILDFTTEWSRKVAEGNSSAINRINDQEKKAVKELTKQAETSFGGNYKAKNTAEYEVFQRELSALQKYYAAERKKVYDKELSDALKNISSWLAKGDLESRLKAIEVEKKQSADKLNKDALLAYGKEYQSRREFRISLANLEKYYNEQNHKARLAQVEEYKSRFQKVLEEIDIKTVEAIKRGDLKGAAVNGAKSAAANALGNTEAGQVVQGFMQGGIAGGIVGIINGFVSGLVKATAALENGNKLLNPFSLIIGKIMDIIGPLVDEFLQPFVDLLETLGTTIGKIIKPFAQIADILNRFEPIIQIIMALLTAIGNIFTGIFELLTPIFNALIRFYNDYIGKFFAFLGGTTKKMKEIGESTDEAAKEAEKHTEMLRKRYQRQMDSVNDLLNAQLSSLQSQYELGLITRDEYNKRAEEYSDIADDKLYEIEQEMNEKLGDIADNTGDIYFNVKTLGDYFSDFGNWIKDGAGYVKDKVVGFFENFWEKLKDSISELFSDTGSNLKEKASNFGGWVKEKLSSAANTAKSVARKIPVIGRYFDVGTPEIPRDMPAIVHKGETIVPRTFAEGIRRGDLALVGGKGKSASSSGNVIQLSLTVQGSVVTENELTDIVYTGIARAIQSGSKAPLPMSA